MEFTGRDIHPGHAKPAAQIGERYQIVMGAGLQQAVFGQGAGRNKAHHFALYNRFIATLFRLFG